MQLSRTDRLIVLFLVALNLLLKLLWLGVNDLAHDEPFTIYWSQRPFPEFLAMLGTENNPPLYFLLIKGWSILAPFEAAWLRVPAALASALVPWPLYLLGRRLGSTRMALTATLLYTLSNYHYAFAHEVRAYALFTLLATLGLWLLVRGREKPNNGARAMMGLSAVNTLMVYSHFFGWLAIGLQLLIVLLEPGYRHLRRTYFIGAAVTLAWFSPYLRIFLLRTTSSVSKGTWLEPPLAEELYNMVWRWSNAPMLTVTFLLLIAIALLWDKLRSQAVRIGLLWSFVPLLGMFVISQFVPLFLDRYLVYAAPGFALLVAASLEGLRLPDRTRNVLATMLVAGMTLTFTPWKEGPRQPGRVVAAVEGYCRSACNLHVLPAWYWLNYLAVADLEALRGDLSDELAGARSVPDGLVDNGMDMVVVDAFGGLNNEDRSWYHEMRTQFTVEERLEADHKVWVYRFRRP